MHLLLLPLLLVAVDADTFTGKVVAVKDGDSIVVLRDKKQVEIRLLDIDCPELDQAFGRYLTQLTTLDAAERRLADIVAGVSTFARQELLWIPNLDPLAAGDLQKLPAALDWLLSASNWRRPARLRCSSSRAIPSANSVAMASSSMFNCRSARPRSSP